MKFMGRTVLVGLVIAQLMGVLGWSPQGVAAQVDGSTYVDPQGRFTMEWQAPWEVLDYQGETPLLVDGSMAVILGGSIPLGSLSLDSCVQLVTLAIGTDDVSTYPVLAQGKTTWRVWIAYQNDTTSTGEYFECQIVPDGSGFAAFAAALTLSTFSDDLVRLTDFLGSTIVQPHGEPAPAIAGDGWRAGIVDWTRGSVFSDLGLAATDGKDWVVAVVDITNQQAASEALSLKDFAVRDVRKSKLNKASNRDSNSASAFLGESPHDGASSLTIPSGSTLRAVLVFIVSDSAKKFNFSFAGRELPLTSTGVVRLGVLHPPARPATLEAATVTDVIDGRTLAVTLNETGEAATVRLIGLKAPVKDECFASEAKEKLAALAETSILLESDASVTDGSSINRHVWTADGSLLIGGELLHGGFATAKSDDHRFQAMYAASEQQASTERTGLWSECNAGSETGETSEPAPLTDADREYLNQLDIFAGTLDSSMPLIAGVLADGQITNLDSAFLAGGLVGVGQTEFWIKELTPTARNEELHAMFVAALAPLTNEARTFSAFDEHVAALENGEELPEFYVAEVDVAALTAAFDATTSLLVDAQARLEAALAEAAA